jgi:uncharacterized membrane protein
MKTSKSDPAGLLLPRVRIRRPRIATGTAVGGLMFLLLIFLSSLPVRLSFVLSWDVGVLVAILLLVRIRGVSPDVMKKIAEQQDAGKWMVLFLTLIAASASLIAIAGEVPRIANAGALEKILRIGLIASTIVLSWAFIHTIFALHYAHDFYSRPKGGRHKDLVFPGEDAPNYMDFVYFSFTIGMTFQVSDVQITDRAFRSLALMHGIISFFYSTVIVALTINLFAGLI